MNHIVQMFSDERIDAFEAHRNCMLANALGQLYLSCVRCAFQTWTGSCAEHARYIEHMQTGRLLLRLIQQADRQCVLVYAFGRWHAHRARIRYMNRVSDAQAEVRHLESLCVRLKVQRASEAYELMATGARISFLDT